MYCHRISALSILSILATTLLPSLTTPATPSWDDMRVKHSWNTVQADWESLGPPPAGTTIDLHVALKPDNENALIDALYEVSTPRHPKYGAHLSKEEAAKLVAPHPDTLEIVHSWLEHHGIPSSSISTTHGGGWLTLAGVPVSQANQLLGASYQLYRHVRTDDSTILRTVGYALPAVLHRHVQTVAPTTFFGETGTLRQTPRKRSVGAAAARAKVGLRGPVTVMASRDEFNPDEITPEFLRWLYKTTAYVPVATEKNALGIAGYADQYPSPEDLMAFMIVFRTDAIPATFTVEQINGGGFDPSDPGVEGNLNMQYTQAIAYPTPHVYYSNGGQLHWTAPRNNPASDDVLLVWLNFMLGQKNIPQTISTSYGLPEKRLPFEYAWTLCNLFAQLGVRGVSVLFSSGDDGVGAGDCKVNVGGRPRVQFIPMFPASCPWVTSVGGTTSRLPEVAASLSGGGFSKHFPRPAYQSLAVPAFLRSFGTTYRGLYNSVGRGIPDISAQALNFMIAYHTNPIAVNGTSCATPVTTDAQTVAAIISLLNDYLLSEGRSPLGFLNPWLYTDGLAGLNDIISGSNPGCGTDGFPAIAGWDPVTGLGTPDFLKLQQLLEPRDDSSTIIDDKRDLLRNEGTSG